MFRDVFVPERYMQSPGSMYDATKQLWFWRYEGDSLYLADQDIVRFKVREVLFQDNSDAVSKDKSTGALHLSTRAPASDAAACAGGR
jgi:DNA-directed RNA polymerase subunit E'/Rpb7